MEGGGGGENWEGNAAQAAPRKLASMRDLASFVLKISDMGLGKQLLNGQSRYIRVHCCSFSFVFCRGGEKRTVYNLLSGVLIYFCTFLFSRCA